MKTRMKGRTGTDAGLSSTSEFASDGTGSSSVKVGVVKDNERSVCKELVVSHRCILDVYIGKRILTTAKLKRHLLHGARGLRHEQLAHSRAASEGDLSDSRVLAKLFAHFSETFLSGDDVDDTGGNASSVAELSKGQGGQRCFARRLHDTSGTGCDGRTDLAGAHAGHEHLLAT